MNFWGVQLKDEFKITDKIKLAVGTDYNDAKTELRYWNAPSPSTGNIARERAASSPNGWIRDLGIYAQSHMKFFNDFLIINPSFRVDFIKKYIIKNFGLESRTKIKK